MGLATWDHPWYTSTEKLGRVELVWKLNWRTVWKWENYPKIHWLMIISPMNIWLRGIRSWSNPSSNNFITMIYHKIPIFSINSIISFMISQDYIISKSSSGFHWDFMGIPTFSRFMASFRQQNHRGCGLGLMVPAGQKAHRAFFPGAGGSKEPASTGKKHGLHMQVSLGLTWFSMAQLGSTRCSTSFNKNKQGSIKCVNRSNHQH